MADRLSALPDELLSLILSKLPIADAIGCSILSKRWRFLYTEMPQLALSPALLTPTRLLPPEPTLRPSLPSMAAMESRISDILRLHSSDLDAFLRSTDADITVPMFGEFRRQTLWSLYTVPMFPEFRRQTLWEWLQCVARKKVQHLLLKCSPNMEIPPPALFSCTRLTTLTLYNYILTDFPSGFVGFKLLTECTLNFIRMTDESLARFLSLCPLLQKFNIEHCDGLKRPVISSSNVRYLNIYADEQEGWTVNCPNLQILNNHFAADLEVNGMRFQELSESITELEMVVGGNLIGLSLESIWNSAGTLSANRFLELMGTLTSLKVLSMRSLIPRFPGEKWTAVPLFKLLSRLPNLERFHLLGHPILEEPERDPTPPFLMSSLPNLQAVEIEIKEYDERELRLLGCLLQIAPALKEVKLPPASKRNNEQRNLFLEKWQSLKKGREQGDITEIICEFSFCFS